MSKQLVYSLAILAAKEATNQWDLLASYCIAWSEDDARAKGRGIAQENFPESEGFTKYHIATCVMLDIEAEVEAYVKAAVAEMKAEAFRVMDERLAAKKSPNMTPPDSNSGREEKDGDVRT